MTWSICFCFHSFPTQDEELDGPLRNPSCDWRALLRIIHWGALWPIVYGYIIYLPISLRAIGYLRSQLASAGRYYCAAARRNIDIQGHNVFAAYCEILIKLRTDFPTNPSELRHPIYIPSLLFLKRSQLFSFPLPSDRR